MAREICPGCGIELEHVEIGMHPYIGASPGCWARYNELHAQQYQGFGALTPVRVIDAYCVQHHGIAERRAIQSVNVHLMALYLQLERGYAESQVNTALRRVLQIADGFTWLEPPIPNGTMTVADILQAQTADDQARAIESYARDIWRAWQAHRAIAEKWAKLAEDTQVRNDQR